eukprot:UN33535
MQSDYRALPNDNGERIELSSFSRTGKVSGFYKPVLRESNTAKFSATSILENCSAYAIRSPFFQILLMIAILFALTLLGGMIFHLSEYWEEKKKIRQAIQSEYEFKNVTANYTDYEKHTIDKYYFYKNAGVPFSQKDNRWGFQSSAYFTVTVYTTIGYGFFAPTTGWGRAWTWLYGQPAILLFSSLALKLNRTTLAFVHSWCQTFKCIKHDKKFKHEPIKVQLLWIVALNGIAFCLGIGFFKLVSKSWDTNTSAYFFG